MVIVKNVQTVNISFKRLRLEHHEKLNWEAHIIIEICRNVGAGIGIMKRSKPFSPMKLCRPSTEL